MLRNRIPAQSSFVYNWWTERRRHSISTRAQIPKRSLQRWLRNWSCERRVASPCTRESIPPQVNLPLLPLLSPLTSPFIYHFILILLFRTMDLSHRTAGWLDVQVGSTRMVFGDRWRQTHIQKKNLHQRTQCKHSSLSPASPPSRFHVSSSLIFLYVGAFGPSVQGLAVLPGSRRRAQRSIPGHWSGGDAFGFSWDAGRLLSPFASVFPSHPPFSSLSPSPLLPFINIISDYLGRSWPKQGPHWPPTHDWIGSLPPATYDPSLFSTRFVLPSPFLSLFILPPSFIYFRLFRFY